VTYRQLANHKRKQSQCVLQERPLRPQSTPPRSSTSPGPSAVDRLDPAEPTSPQRQFDPFDSGQAPLTTPPSGDFQDVGNIGDGDGDEAPARYLHIVSPEPRTSALGQQDGPRFEPVDDLDPHAVQEPGSPVDPEDPEFRKKLECVTFIKGCGNGKGLSRHDQNWLLSFANIPGLNNSKDVQDFIDALPVPVSIMLLFPALDPALYHLLSMRNEVEASMAQEPC
jgi:hypothetical protein